DFAGAAARCSAQGTVREICTHALRAFGLDRQRADWLCEKPDGLYLPLAAPALSVRRATDVVRGIGAAGSAIAGIPHSAVRDRFGGRGDRSAAESREA